MGDHGPTRLCLTVAIVRGDYLDGRQQEIWTWSCGEPLPHVGQTSNGPEHTQDTPVTLRDVDLDGCRCLS